ncbi:MAG: PKD domain-containing protein, partial [Sedimenticolaceae bacterium]
VSLSVQATGNRGIPRNWHSRHLLLACALLFGLSGATTAWAADAIEIERANWSNDRDRLTVRGKNAPNNATVTISYGKIEDHGTELGTTQADGDGDWTFRFPNPDPVPCDVTAQAGGNADDKNVRRAPNNCSNEGGSQPPPANQTPTANANGPYAGTTGAAVSFSSAGSGDSDGTIASYNWTFGDGNTSISANPNHSYATAGVYNVSLAVTDNQGAAASDSATATITVATASCTPGDLNVSINSTSQDGCPDAKVPQQAIVHNSTHSVLAINDLGMHCGDLDTRIASILPPFQVLLAQVVQKGGTPTLNPAGVTVYYSAASHNPGDLGPDDLIGDPILDSDVFDGVLADGNTYKTNFWDAVNQGTYDPFYPGGLGITPLASGGFPVAPDVGLPVPNVEELYIGADGVVDQNCDQPGATCDGTLTAVQHAMPGIAAPYTANNPKEAQEHYADKPFFVNFPFGYVAADVNWYEGAGVAFAAFDDNGRENAYPLVRVQAKNGNTVLSTVDTVLPISGEASCTNCHADPADLLSITGLVSRTNDPTDELGVLDNPATTDVNEGVALSMDDPNGNLPPRVSLEYAADINILRLHDLKHGAKYVNTSCDTAGVDCVEDESTTDPCT